MDWTIKGPREANHNPEAIVDGDGGRRRRAGKAPVMIDAAVGQPVVLDAAGTTDPDGHALTYTWFFYPEAGTGIPDARFRGGRPAGRRRRQSDEGGIPSAPEGPPEPAPRAIVRQAAGARTSVMPHAAGIAHVILAVEDNGTPSLTSYRRVIIRIKPGLVTTGRDTHDARLVPSNAGRQPAAIQFGRMAEKQSRQLVEIPVNDIARATRFYESVFAVKLDPMEMGPAQMAMFPMNQEGTNASGALVKTEGYVPSHAGTVVYFAVGDIEGTLTKIGASGGSTLVPKMSIGPYGFIAQFQDSEGNRVALHSMS